MRWNPFVRAREFHQLQVQTISLATTVQSLAATVTQQAHLLTRQAHALAELREQVEHPLIRGNAAQPLTAEEREIAEDFLKNNKLRSEIVADFAAGGPVPQDHELGLVGETPLETRRKPFPHETFDVSQPKE